MRRVPSAVLIAAVAFPLAAQTSNRTAVKPSPAAAASTPGAVSDLPVRKVVLYKSGVGYFEHAGTVNGNQRVSIDFTSSQLNDVLQSLTALDGGGGKVSAVSYNSTTPLAEQLKSLAIGLDEDTTFSKFFTAIRGARVEVRSGGGSFAGRVMDIEMHKSGAGKDSSEMVEKRFLTVVSDAGEVRVFEMTPALEVRLLEPGLERDVNRYLELLDAAHETGLRHLTLEDRGEGERQLQVSYISQVPVWKSTYRIVFPREANGNATVQGWAVVDDTVGVDWNNVQLSLVAGAPQSFIQPLSEPIYTRRPEIPISTVAQNTPQTHEAAEQNVSSHEAEPAAVPPAPPASFGVVEMQGRAAGSGGGLGSGSGAGYGPGMGGNVGGGLYKVGGVYRASDAIQQGDVSTNAFDDFFEYTIAQPVTIHQNESAMVPILQQDLPAEHVTLWSDREPTPLRALWLENKSKLTLDSGSFSVFENGEFAGEGLLDPIHPGEKRLLSYAVDQAVKVHRVRVNETRTLRHIALAKGILVETTSEVTENTYTVTNAADEARAVVVEHARRPKAELDSDEKPAETTATAYRFSMAVEPHQSVDLHVKERANLSERIDIRQGQFRDEYLANVSKYSPDLQEKLRPLIDAESALSELNNKIAENNEKQKTLADDEARDRDNVTALKGNDAAKRFVEELNQAEDELQTARKEQADLEKQRDAAQAQLDDVIAKLQFDTDLDVVTSTTG